VTAVRFATKEVLEQTLSVGELSRSAGVAPSAVRFYERHGLIRAYRTTGNQRRFHPDAICRIKVARTAQQVGLTVREISEVLGGLPDDCGPQDWERVGALLVREGEARIRRLERVVKELATNEVLCAVDTRIET
jgi:MerR family transcriptional regulator, redox-sensitive transcriptional activator SoxR